MRQVLAELCELLLEQKHIIGSMIELSLEERRIIVGGEAEKLEDIVRQELRELSKLGAIEKKRAALNAAVCAQFGLHEKDITISAIADRAEPEEREAVMRLQTELITLIGQHTVLNLENRELIKAHIEYSESMLELMVGSEDPLNNFYSGDGKAVPDRKKTTGFFNGHA